MVAGAVNARLTRAMWAKAVSPTMSIIKKNRRREF